MDAVRTGSIVSLVVSMVLLGACGPRPTTRPREGAPAVADTPSVIRVDVGMMSPPPAPPPTPPVATPSPAPLNQPPSDEIQPSTPTPGASAVIGATGGAGANVRTGPSMRAPVITTLREGTPVEALGEPVAAEGRQWQAIRIGDREGWVVAVVIGTVVPPTVAPAAGAVTPVSGDPQTGTPPPMMAPAHIIAATGGTAVNLRQGPSMAAPTIATLAEGTPVEALGEPVPAEGRTWQKVRSGDREGWVVAAVVQPR